MISAPESSTKSEPQQKPGFFQEDNGNSSSMRLMCFTALLASIGFGFLAILYKGANAEGVYITFGFLIAAFAPKAVQKFAEQKISDQLNE